jgi:Tol biopolymer transport system component
MADRARRVATATGVAPYLTRRLRNLVRQGVAKGVPGELTPFKEGRILSYRYSRDGRRLLFRRELNDAVNAWIANADGSDPRQLTEFPTGVVFNMKWTRDQERIIFTYGTAGDDVVLIDGSR